MFLWYNKELLTQGQIQRLQKHKYATDSFSFVDPYLQTWWNWVVTFLPMWLAPNLITVSGLAINLAAAFTLIFSCPNATEEVSRWIPLAVGVCMFIYQTLDAIDGKQARRTGSSNALGELFDHGCDSLSNLVLAIAGACAMGMGYLEPFWMMGYCFLGVFLFYLAHWQAYVTGRMRFGNIDATEAQFSMIFVMLVTGLFGTQFWGNKLFGFVSLRLCPLVMGTIFAFMSLPATVNRILFCGAGKNGSTVAGSSVLGPLIPLALVILPAFYLAATSPANVFEKNPILYIMTFGLMASKMTNKLIVAHMSKSELESFDHVLFVTLVIFLNQSKGPFVSEYYLLVLACVFTVVDYFLHCCRICYDICNLTGWYLFRINVPSDCSSKNGSKSKSS